MYPKLYLKSVSTGAISEITHLVVPPWTDFEFDFFTPWIIPGEYLLIAENEFGESNEYPFTIDSDENQVPILIRLRNLYTQKLIGVAGDPISCSTKFAIPEDGCREFHRNLLQNGSFCTDTSSWQEITNNDGAFAASIDDRELVLTVTNTGTTPDSINCALVQGGIRVKARRSYSLDIMTSTNVPVKAMDITIITATETFTKRVPITQRMCVVKIPPFTFFQDGDATITLAFGGNNNAGNLRIAFINLQELV
jgi:hypothetical protein